MPEKQYEERYSYDVSWSWDGKEVKLKGWAAFLVGAAAISFMLIGVATVIHGLARFAGVA